MSSKQTNTKRITLNCLFYLSFAIHLLLPFLVFISNFSSLDWQVLVSSYFSPLWVIVLIWLLWLLLIIRRTSKRNFILVDVIDNSYHYLQVLTDKNCRNLNYLNILNQNLTSFTKFLRELINKYYSLYLKSKKRRLGIFFMGIFVFSWYLLPGLHNFINTFVSNLAIESSLKFEHLINYFSIQLPKIVSILLWELIIFWLLSVLIYVVAKRKNIFKKQNFILLEQYPRDQKQHSLWQKLWSIVIFPFKELGTQGKAIISILAVLFVIFAFVLSSPHFPGAGTVYLAGVAAVVGLIFTWSASAAIADFISGIILIFLTNLEKGDCVKIGDVRGKIHEQNLLVHQIKTTKNTIVTIPNANVLRNIITNYTPSRKRTGVDRPQIIYTTVTLGYDVNQKDAINALENAAKSTLDIITKENAEDKQKKFEENLKKNSAQTTLSKEDFEEIKELYNKIINGKPELKPFVLITSLDDFYVSYELNAYLDPGVSLLDPERIPTIYSELHQNIQNECLDKEIEILSPHYQARRDGNIPAVPEERIEKFSRVRRPIIYSKHYGNN